MGRAAGRGLRRARVRAWRLLRTAHPAQARGPARARGGRGVRAYRRRAAADHGAAYPGGRGGGGRVPAMTAVAAVDLGASGGRVMVGMVGPGELELHEAHRFGNVPVAVHGTLHWDILRLHGDILTGLRAASGEFELASVGIDSWGVDYGLLDSGGALLGNPVHYRDARTTGVAERVHASVSRREMYQVTGTAQLPLNTIYQLV